MSVVEFWRDDSMELIIKDIIEIFTILEDVELVRLNGLTLRLRTLSGREDLQIDSVDIIVKKLRDAKVIQFKYIINCPHCGETSYVIKCSDDFLFKPKMCDSCSTFYTLMKDTNLHIND